MQTVSKVFEKLNDFGCTEIGSVTRHGYTEIFFNRRRSGIVILTSFLYRCKFEAFSTSFFQHSSSTF